MNCGSPSLFMCVDAQEGEQMSSSSSFLGAFKRSFWAMASDEGAEETRTGAEEEEMAMVGALQVPVHRVLDASEEVLLLWSLQQPCLAQHNAHVNQSSQLLQVDACGHILRISQAPSALNTPGVTGAVMWDSGVVLGKFLEHAVDSLLFRLEGRKCVELGAGCGLVGCIAALLGAQVILTDLPDRLRLLQKNVQQNTENLSAAALALVKELTWGDDLEREFVDLSPDFVLASDVVYNEMAVHDLLSTLRALCSNESTVFLAAELRNDSVLEYFLDLALKEFKVGRVPETLWHPDFQSKRVVVYVMAKRHNEEH